MGFLGGFLDFFSEETGETRNQGEVSQNVNTDVAGSQSTETGSRTKSSGTQSTDATTQQTQTTTQKLFSPEEEEALKGVLAGIIGQFGAQGGTVPQEFLNASSAAVGDAGELSSRSKGAEEALQAQFAPILSEARRSGEKNIAGSVSRLAGAVGGGLDSGVAAVEAEANAELESRLAALNSELNINARGVETDERTKAITALLAGAESGGQLSNLSSTSGIGNIAEISSLLRGATTSSETSGQVVSQQEMTTAQLSEALQEVFSKFDQSTRSKSSGSSTSNTQTSQTGSLLDVLNGIGGLANP